MLSIVKLKIASFGLSQKIETDTKGRVATIKTYYESGGDVAEDGIRHVAGYCVEKDAGGTIPETFKEFAGDLFIFLLTDSKATSQQVMMREFLNQDPQRFNRQMAAWKALRRWSWQEWLWSRRNGRKTVSFPGFPAPITSSRAAAFCRSPKADGRFRPHGSGAVQTGVPATC